MFVDSHFTPVKDKKQELANAILFKGKQQQEEMARHEAHSEETRKKLLQFKLKQGLDNQLSEHAQIGKYQISVVKAAEGARSRQTS